jgi:phenylpyruvate tautomerase PptA (4-oxalocrotonate tautomerase family)
MMVSIDECKGMILGGSSTSSAAYCELSSIGHINNEMNTRLTKEVADLLQKHFSIDQGRVYVTFHDIKGSNWGCKDATMSFLDNAN